MVVVARVVVAAREAVPVVDVARVEVAFELSLVSMRIPPAEDFEDETGLAVVLTGEEEATDEETGVMTWAFPPLHPPVDTMLCQLPLISPYEYD